MTSIVVSFHALTAGLGGSSFGGSISLLWLGSCAGDAWRLVHPNSDPARVSALSWWWSVLDQAVVSYRLFG